MSVNFAAFVGSLRFMIEGWLGIFTGGLTAAAGGITAAVVFAVLMALLFKPGNKR